MFDGLRKLLGLDAPAPKAQARPKMFEDGSMMSSSGLGVGVAQPQRSLSVQPLNPNASQWQSPQSTLNPMDNTRRGWEMFDPTNGDDNPNAVLGFNAVQRQGGFSPRQSTRQFGEYVPAHQPMQGGLYPLEELENPYARYFNRY